MASHLLLEMLEDRLTPAPLLHASVYSVEISDTTSPSATSINIAQSQAGQVQFVLPAGYKFDSGSTVGIGIIYSNVLPEISNQAIVFTNPNTLSVILPGSLVNLGNLGIPNMKVEAGNVAITGKIDGLAVDLYGRDHVTQIQGSHVTAQQTIYGAGNAISLVGPSSVQVPNGNAGVTVTSGSLTVSGNAGIFISLGSVVIQGQINTGGGGGSGVDLYGNSNLQGAASFGTGSHVAVHGDCVLAAGISEVGLGSSLAVSGTLNSQGTLKLAGGTVTATDFYALNLIYEDVGALNPEAVCDHFVALGGSLGFVGNPVPGYVFHVLTYKTKTGDFGDPKPRDLGNGFGLERNYNSGGLDVTKSPTLQRQSNALVAASTAMRGK